MQCVDDRSSLEEEITTAFAAHDYEHAATLAIRGYGPEILGLLLALHRDKELVAESFSQFCEDVWKGLPKFAKKCTFRTWMYTLARHALHRSIRGEKRRARRHSPMASFWDAEEQVRSQTLSFLRTDVKDRITALRESLPQEDQTLLILRVDRGMAWTELAQIFSNQPELAGEELKREAARLRKRFQFVREQLRELAKKEGLLNKPEA
jgi:RNA polymerase sigma-70 factor (ECF subfamily)